MTSLFYVTYLAGLICLYAVLGYTFGLKITLLLLGAVHGGSLLLLLALCWRDRWSTAPVDLQEALHPSYLYS